MISITTTALTVLPAYSYKGIVFDITTTAYGTGVVGLRIKAEIFYLSGGVWVKIGTKKQEPYLGLFSGTNPIYRFNVDGYLQSILTYNFATTAGSFLFQANNSMIPFKVRFSEEYRDVNGIIQEYNAVETATKYAANIARQIYEVQEIQPDYVMNEAAPGKFLTDRPGPIKQRPLETTQLSFIYTMSGPSKDVLGKVKIFRANGTTTTLTVNRFAITNPPTHIRMILSLYNIFNTTDLSALVWLETLGGVKVSEELEIVPDRTLWGSTTRFLWLNKFGGFDDYTFKGLKEVKNKIKRTEFKAVPVNSASSRGFTSLNNISNDELTVYSQFEGIDVIENLSEIFYSPQVYIVENGQYIPVNVENSGVELKQTNTVKQIKLTYTKAVERLIQNG